ncbi:hypothetical protein BKA62DRAFT_672494 [Auriculariales sp. MPI-PUGE-AT-0066]|nr:hypothetical protein BKA62DRAFT_672494 [Auriculariales sp. MPI-PUGE-AT-0066]
MCPQKHEEAKFEELRAKLLALPESPHRAISEFRFFVRHCYRTSAITGKFESTKVNDMWKALSDSERQQFKAEADISQLSVAEYDESAQAVGYTNLREINRDRVLSGKKRLRIPASLRPDRNSPGFRTFLEEKVASGEVSTLDGLEATRKRARELWRDLTPSQRAAYYTQWAADYEKRLAARSQA